MRKKTKTYKKIAKALEALGIKGSVENCICAIEKDSIDYLIYIDEETETFSVMQYVTGLRGTLTKQEFDTSLEVAKEFHKEYDGDWNYGISYFSSPTYGLKGIKTIPGDQLKKIIADFDEAWTFMCYMCDY